MFGTVAKKLPRTLTSQVKMPRSCQISSFLIQLPTDWHPGERQMKAQLLVSLPPTGRTRWSSGLLATDWSSPSCCRHFGNEQTYGRFLCVSAALSLSLFIFSITLEYKFLKRDTTLVTKCLLSTCFRLEDTQGKKADKTITGYSGKRIPK